MNAPWPSKIIFKFTHDKKPIHNLLVYVVLLSKSKNNISIGNFLSDKKGQIQTTRDELIEKIDDTKTEFPMDYSGSLDDCAGVEVVVETIEEIRNRIKTGREFYPNTANKMEKMLQECKNRKYIGKRVVYHKPVSFEVIDIEMEHRGQP